MLKAASLSLASKYGLAADQALEWEVVTSSGSYLKATPTENSDLYWALSGGGGGTYAVVYSLTAKAHPDIPVAAGNLSFASDGTSQDIFFDAVAAYHAWVPSIVDQGVTVLASGSNTTFAIGPIIAPGWSLAELRTSVRSLTDKLDELGVKYSPPFSEVFPGYWPAMQRLMFDVSVGNELYGGRLIPRSVVRDNAKAVVDVLRNITNHGGVTYSSIALNLNRTVTGKAVGENAVLPAWRDALLDIVLAV